MIAEGMQIQIRRSGARVRVETLEIGDLVYDPIADNYHEIIDILSRSSFGSPELLWLVPAGSLAGGRPYGDLLVSRRQVLLAARIDAEARDFVEPTPAFELGTLAGQERRLFAIFLERGGYILVNGVCARALDQPVPRSDGQPSISLRPTRQTLPRAKRRIRNAASKR